MGSPGATEISIRIDACCRVRKLRFGSAMVEHPFTERTITIFDAVLNDLLSGQGDFGDAPNEKTPRVGRPVRSGVLGKGK